MKNIWGTAPNDGRESWDSVPRKPTTGSLSAITKKTGDGHWCPVCFKNGHYSWCEWRPCATCETRAEDMCQKTIVEIMKNH